MPYTALYRVFKLRTLLTTRGAYLKLVSAISVKKVFLQKLNIVLGLRHHVRHLWMDSDDTADSADICHEKLEQVFDHFPK